MNLGGTEKALLSFINALEGKKCHVILLLLESGGVLYDAIPGWVEVVILPRFEQMKPIIYDPPQHLSLQQLRRGAIFEAFQTIKRYLTIKASKKWYLNYIVALKNEPVAFEVNIAIAFAGPSDFISYYIHKQVKADRKIQWIHFDVSKVVYNTNFGNTYYTYFDAIYCVSANAKQVFDNIFPQYKDKTYVFENIVSKVQLDEMSTHGDTFDDDFEGFRLLTIGRLSGEKGQDMIPAVVRRLRDEGYLFRWYLIGDGDLRPVIEKKIREMEISDELVLLGSKINPYRYLKDCDLYVQSSLHEGYCITIHEAKIFDRPVVTTAVASAANLIVHNGDGLIVDISENGLFHGVKEILENPALMTAFSRFMMPPKSTEHKIDVGRWIKDLFNKVKMVD